MKKEQIATGFEFTPLPNGRVLMEFYRQGGKTINSQMIDASLLKMIAITAHMTDQVVHQGREATMEDLGRGV
jgi:hypothetical protein